MKWIRVCRVSDLPIGQARCVDQLGYRIGVFHLEEGFFAIDNTCPHHETDLHLGIIEKGHVLCPMHAWRFNLSDGACSLSADYDLATYPVEIREEHLYLGIQE